MAIFGDLAVQLDPWQVDYGSELPLDELEKPTPDDTVALDVEIPAETWQPIRPGDATVPAQLIFVGAVDSSSTGAPLPRGIRKPRGWLLI
jgi:hypothetical protein